MVLLKMCITIGKALLNDILMVKNNVCLQDTLYGTGEHVIQPNVYKQSGTNNSSN